MYSPIGAHIRRVFDKIETKESDKGESGKSGDQPEKFSQDMGLPVESNMMPFLVVKTFYQQACTRVYASFPRVRLDLPQFLGIKNIN